MELVPHRFFKEPAFQVGLAIRLILTVFAVPWTQAEWFVPFLQGSFANPSLDPWSNHLANGGNILSFPYGPIMFLAYLPGVLIGSGLDWIFSCKMFAVIGVGLTNLAFDFALAVILRDFLATSYKKILYLYWLSPITLYVGYWCGQTDIIPVFFLIVSLYALKHLKARLTGFLLGLAIASKLSMVLAIPFLLIYFWQSKKVRSIGGEFFLVLLVTVILLQVPYFFKEGVQVMLLGNREMQKIYHFSIQISDGVHLFLVPFAYLLTLYWAWRLGRMNLDLLFFCIGIGFLLILILTPASVGWYFWVLPFLVAHQVGTGLTSVFFVSVFTLFFLANAPLASAGAALPIFGLDFSQTQDIIRERISVHLISLMQTGMTASGAVLCWQFFREGIRKNDYFRLSRKPLAIAIAGDSGSGKDTLDNGLKNLFGFHSVVSVSCDNYHNWERQSPMWKTLTHLNPRANNLLVFANDVQALIDNRSILSREYDHERGRFTRATVVNKNDTIIASGLHALYIPVLNEKFDVRIFLDIDEELRRYFKVRRDVCERGYSVERSLELIESRREDAEHYIKPQMEAAEIVFRLQPVNYDDLSLSNIDTNIDIPLKLKALLKRNIYYKNLIRVLIGVCGMRIDVDYLDSPGAVELDIEGEVNGKDMAMAAGLLVPYCSEILALEPKWMNGITGLMQLIVLIQSAHVLQERGYEHAYI